MVIVLQKIAQDLLGSPNHVLSTEYISSAPANVIIRKAHIFNQERQEIWSGDLDLTENFTILQQLAEELGPIAVSPHKAYFSETLPADYDFDAPTAQLDAWAEGVLLYTFKPNEILEAKHRLEQRSQRLRKQGEYHNAAR